jgi:peptidoglycan glycosyltransferase
MATSTRRNTELGLIILAAIITVAAYTLAGIGETSSIPADIWPFLGIVLALLVVAHVFNRKLVPRADGILVPLAALLNGIGYVFIARLNDELADNQAAWIGIGIAAYIVTLLVVRRSRDLQRYRYTFMAIGLGLLLLPLVPLVGQEINGARIWVGLGPVNFQPGEFAKIALAIFFAGYLVDKRELLGMATWPKWRPMLPDPKHLGPVLVAWGVSLLVMVAQKDLGSSLLFFALFILMLWISTERSAYLAVGTVLFAAGAYFAWTTFAHVQDRIATWLDPWPDGQDEGFQVIQSWFSLAWGGMSGTGIGLGEPERIPVVETDFIFSAIGEELGLFGAAAVITAYLLIIGAGLRIAVRTTDPFEKLLAAGLTILIGVQAFIIMAGVTRLLPLTGVTLPFVSYGGSSLLANYVLLALLMRISDDGAARAELAESRSQAPLVEVEAA